MVDLLQYLLVDDWKPQQQADIPAVNQRLQLFLVYLLYYKRNGHYEVRPDLSHGIQDNLRSRKPGQEMHMRTGAELHQELEQHPVHMGRRQHGHAVGGIVQMTVHLKAEQDVGENGAVRQHHPLGESGST